MLNNTSFALLACSSAKDVTLCFKKKIQNRILNLSRKSWGRIFVKIQYVALQYWILAVAVRPYKILTHNLHVPSSNRSDGETSRGNQHERVYPFLPGMLHHLWADKYHFQPSISLGYGIGIGEGEEDCRSWWFVFWLTSKEGISVYAEKGTVAKVFATLSFYKLDMNFQRRSHSTAGKRDKVDAAFHKYDSNKDGYLSKEEFGVVSLN